MQGKQKREYVQLILPGFQPEMSNRELGAAIGELRNLLIGLWQVQTCYNVLFARLQPGNVPSNLVTREMAAHLRCAFLETASLLQSISDLLRIWGYGLKGSSMTTRSLGEVRVLAEILEEILEGA